MTKSCFQINGFVKISSCSSDNHIVHFAIVVTNKCNVTLTQKITPGVHLWHSNLSRCIFYNHESGFMPIKSDPVAELQSDCCLLTVTKCMMMKKRV